MLFFLLLLLFFFFNGVYFNMFSSAAGFQLDSPTRVHVLSPLREIG